MTEFLDTNVLVRFLAGDVPAQKRQAIQWFAEAQKGEREIKIAALVVAETVFVLENFYKQSRRNIAAALEIFLSQRWLQVEERDVLLKALSVFEKGRHFVDSYLLALSRIYGGDILTFDKKLKKIYRNF